MATWNEDKPALANQISADVPDIKENFEFLALFARERRSIFTYNGGTTAYTIKCKSAYYYCKDKVCWWDAELTTTAIGTPSASDWYYLYLDHSGITSGTEITNSELLWSATEPAWNATYAAWMNGDDRCIFAARTDSGPSNILEFFHDGDLVFYADAIADLAETDIDTTWTDQAITMPVFYRALVRFMSVYVDGSSSFSWRTNGQTGTTGHTVGYVTSESTRDSMHAPVYVDSAQKIEIKSSAANGNRVAVQTQGWYLPIGM